jgi:CDP-2,3-bis-(O-geranylgeranyl)-sn-glycerol synthase
MFVLLLVANGSPVVLSMLTSKPRSWPVDLGLYLSDGQPLFGPSKSLPGLAVAVFATTFCSLLVGPSIWIGLLVGFFAMLGDLLSSFVKRRLGLTPGASAIGLDQIPESLLPLLICKPLLGLSWTQVLLLTLAFVVANLLISQFRKKARSRLT